MPLPFCPKLTRRSFAFSTLLLELGSPRHFRTAYTGIRPLCLSRYSPRSSQRHEFLLFAKDPVRSDAAASLRRAWSGRGRSLAKPGVAARQAPGPPSATGASPPCSHPCGGPASRSLIFLGIPSVRCRCRCRCRNCGISDPPLTNQHTVWKKRLSFFLNRNRTLIPSEI